MSSTSRARSHRAPGPPVRTGPYRRPGRAVLPTGAVLAMVLAFLVVFGALSVGVAQQHAQSSRATGTVVSGRVVQIKHLTKCRVVVAYTHRGSAYRFDDVLGGRCPSTGGSSRVPVHFDARDPSNASIHPPSLVLMGLTALFGLSALGGLVTLLLRRVRRPRAAPGRGPGTVATDG